MQNHSRRLSNERPGMNRGPARWAKTRGVSALALVAALTLVPTALAFAEDAPAELAAPVSSEAVTPSAPTAETPTAVPTDTPAEVAPEPEAQAEPPAAPAPEAAAVVAQAAPQAEAQAPAPVETAASVAPQQAPLDSSSKATTQAPDTANKKKDDRPLDHVWICHALGKGNGGYNLIYPANMGVLEGHVGVHHQDARDIIPPIPEYEFVGQNWNEETQAIHENSCQTPDPEVPAPIVYEVTVVQCTVSPYTLPGTVAVMLTSLLKDSSYNVTVTKNSAVVDSEELSASGSTATLNLSLSGAGEYTVTVTDTETEKSGSLEFTVLPCPTPVEPPTASLDAEPCSAVGQGTPSTATLEMDGLVSGTEYTATVTDPNGDVVLSHDFTATGPTATAEVNLAIAGDYEITLSDDTHEVTYGPFESTIAPCPPTVFDLSIVKTAAAKSGGVWQGDTILYSLTITNEGPAAASSPVVTDHLPDGLTLGEVVDLDGWTVQDSDSESISFVYEGDYAAGESATITFQATVASVPAPVRAAGELMNTACVTAEPPMAEIARALVQAEELDTENNCSTATTTVTPPTVVPANVIPPAVPAAPAKQVTSPLAVTGSTGEATRLMTPAAALLLAGASFAALAYRGSRRAERK